MGREDRYLQKRGRRWHYVRRVPEAARGVDSRTFVRVTLKTNSLEIARERRDALEAADDQLWGLLEAASEAPEDTLRRARELAGRRYKAATTRATARGFVYAPADELRALFAVDEVMDRISALERMSPQTANAVLKAEAEALLGGVPRPAVTLSEAFAIYCDEIALGELLRKSPGQRHIWRKTKLRAVTYFAEVVGDKAISEITREDALKFYNWWADRLRPKKGADPKGANTANRDLGNLRKLYREYFRHIGEESRPNPFRNLAFKETISRDVPAFPDDWVRERILVPGVLEGINPEARLIAYALIETGCRPSEIANLLPEDICLEADIPHIRIRPRKDREIKTATSIRDLPLVGVSLAAMRQAPGGFPHYRDRNDLLSQSLVKAFRNRGLMPTEKHVIYSFRHSFEKRMLEAGLDYGLRCLLMGHATNRPAYGDGGSLTYRRDELLKIVHPYPKDLFV
ncbi:MAG: integrase [Alphaproteobacteria bacterium HGW-Alphaproteobacteria-18]|nr:MAG: integrase [Alphaproteobacteria bacterium HGW-Alphaproteobacteria-18]